MRKKQKLRAAAVLTAATLFAGGLPWNLPENAYGADRTAGQAAYTETEDTAEGLLESFQTAISYEEYLKKQEGIAPGSGDIILEGGAFTEASDDFKRAEQFKDWESSAVLTEEEGSVTWTVEVPEAGWYQLLIDYYPMEGKNGTIERELSINGEIPFDGAKYLEFTRRWENAEEIQKDAREDRKSVV